MEPKKYVIDIFCEIDAEDIGTEVELFEGDVKDPETGRHYKGTFIIKSLEAVDEYEEEITSDRQL